MQTSAGSGGHTGSKIANLLLCYHERLFYYPRLLIHTEGSITRNRERLLQVFTVHYRLPKFTKDYHRLVQDTTSYRERLLTLTKCLYFHSFLHLKKFNMTTNLSLCNFSSSLHWGFKSLNGHISCIYFFGPTLTLMCLIINHSRSNPYKLFFFWVWFHSHRILVWCLVFYCFLWSVRNNFYIGRVVACFDLALVIPSSLVSAILLANLLHTPPSRLSSLIIPVSCVPQLSPAGHHWRRDWIWSGVITNMTTTLAKHYKHNNFCFLQPK